MSKAERYIELVSDENGHLCDQHALKAVEIAREEMIDKVIGWIEEINNHHYIIRYSDSCEPPISELIEWFKNYMKEGGKDE